MKKTFAAYAIVDCEGNVAYGTDEDSARDQYEQEVIELGAIPWRLIRIPFTVTLPADVTEVPAITVADE